MSRKQPPRSQVVRACAKCGVPAPVLTTVRLDDGTDQIWCLRCRTRHADRRRRERPGRAQAGPA